MCFPSIMLFYFANFAKRKSITIDDLVYYTTHSKQKKHRRAIERQLNNKRKKNIANNTLILTNLTSKKSTINMYLSRALISANIPLNKL